MATSKYNTGYEALDSEEEAPHQTLQMDDEEAPSEMDEDSHRTQYNHIENLDDFFTRIYQYYLRKGFRNIVQEEILQILQCFFIFFLIPGFLSDCVDYDKLFDKEEKPGDALHKYHLADVIIVPCRLGFGTPVMTLYNIVVIIVLILLILKMMYNASKYLEIKRFYSSALKIEPAVLPDKRWPEILQLLIEAQKEHEMCIHKPELTELDVSNRILRFKNYFVAMVNKSLIQFKFKVPFLGERIFLSHGLKYNLEMLLFWGPGSPFQNNWHLKKPYKIIGKRSRLANELSKRIFWLGLANLVLMPVIFLWQMLHFFFMYAELLKRDPSSMGKKQWSLYARSYLRHFNELDHELNTRLEVAHPLSVHYLQGFKDPFTTLIAKNMAFYAGAVLALLLCLSLWDEDTLLVGGMLQLMAGLGIILGVARSFIPEENQVFDPEVAMTKVIGQIHYCPDRWTGKFHMTKVRDEFAQLFQSKAIFLLEEILSPLVTPFILLFSVRPRSLEIVDFFRNFTIDVVGVGDVCSFAQMTIRKHGHRKWLPPGKSSADKYHRSEGGKTELSLVRFQITNPDWKAESTELAYLNNLQQQALQDAAGGGRQLSALQDSAQSVIGSLPGDRGPADSQTFGLQTSEHSQLGAPRMRSSARGANYGSTEQHGVLRALAQSGHLSNVSPGLQHLANHNSLNYEANEMSFTSIYMRGLSNRTSFMGDQQQNTLMESSETSTHSGTMAIVHSDEELDISSGDLSNSLLSSATGMNVIADDESADTGMPLLGQGSSRGPQNI